MSRPKKKQRTPIIKPGKKAYRRMLKFWLDMVKPEERALYEDIDRLKDRGQYTAAIRDGLQFIIALRSVEDAVKGGSPPPSGALDKLESEFPHTLRWIREMHHSAELERLRAELAQLRSSVGTMGIAPAVYKPRAAMEAPTVKLNTASSGKAVSNFMTSMKALKTNG